MNKSLFIVLLLFSAVILSGCPQSSTSDSPVIAKVDKAAITEEEFLKEVSRVPEWARPQFNGMEGKEKFLDELIKRELIYQEALDMKLDNNKEYIEKVKEFERMTLVSLILKKEVEDKVTVDDSEVREFYDQNAEKFTVGTQIRASHILVETEDEAKDIYAKIQKGDDFGKLAKSFSKDKGSAEKGGDLGFFSQGKMVPEFERAVLSLKPGEISEPVRTRFGYHIIKQTDIKKGSPANFEQTKESIEKQLLSQKRKEFFDAYIDRLKSKMTVTKEKDTLAAISLPWEKTETPEPAQTAETPEPAETETEKQ